MEAPPRPDQSPEYDPEVEEALARAHAYQDAAGGWYRFGQATGAVLSAFVGLAVLYGALLLVLVVIGGFELTLREVLGVTLAGCIIGAAYRRGSP